MAALETKNAFSKSWLVALYANMEMTDYFSVFEVTYSSYDEHYHPLPAGEKREYTRAGYVRISEPVEVDFVATNNDEVIQRAVASLDAQELEAVQDLNKKVAKIRERKQQLLAISFQPDVAT